MAEIRPFAALRPDPALAAQICELPYDVLSAEEARRAAAHNPLSFFYVSKAEIALPPGTDPYSECVYDQAKKAFQGLIGRGALRQDDRPFFYLYRQTCGNHSQLGLVAAASCQDYLQHRILKHEFTRPDKEDDRVRHIERLSAQTGPVFLVYRAQTEIDQLLKGAAQELPTVDFTAPDGVRHSGWVLKAPETIRAIEEAFAQLPALYIADGHHRSAAAARVFQSRKGAGGSGSFLAVIFPHREVQILPYYRVVKDLHGRSPSELLAELAKVFEPSGGHLAANPREVGVYLAGQWHSFRFRKALLTGGDPIAQLDVTLLQQHVLAPLFGIDDPRTSQRIQFVGGIRGTQELKRLVDEGQGACAFALNPTRIEELMAIADAGGIMPPKSTWFEPKLRDAMFTHLI